MARDIVEVNNNFWITGIYGDIIQLKDLKRILFNQYSAKRTSNYNGNSLSEINPIKRLNKFESSRGTAPFTCTLASNWEAYFKS